MDIPKETIEKYIALHEKQFDEKLDYNLAESRFKQLVRLYLLLGKKTKKKSSVEHLSDLH